MNISELELLKKENDLLKNEIALFRTINRKIHFNMDFNEILNHIVVSLAENLKIDRCNIGIIDDNDEYMTIHNTNQLFTGLSEETKEYLDKNYINRKFLYKKHGLWLCVSARENKEMYYPEIKPENFGVTEQVYFEKGAVSSCYSLPINFENKVYGAIILINSNKDMYLTEFEKNMIRERVELIARLIDSHKLFNQIKEQKDELKKKNDIISEDLMLAKRIQQNLLPKVLPEISNIEIATKYIPMIEVGGDYYDFSYSKSDKSFGVLITDASGHGVPAAFITSMVKMSFNETFVRHNYNSPSFVLSQINDSILDKMESNFVTAFYAFFDFQNMIMKASCAGHPPLYIINRINGEVKSIQPKGRILGLFEKLKFEEIELNINKGDRFFFYTDGLTEAIDKDGNEFEAKLLELFKEFYSLDSKNFCNTIINNLNLFALSAHKKTFDDDVAIVIVDVN